jgi:preprotein translocase subunit YajC
MLISSAYAQAAGAAPGGLDSQIMSFAPLVLIFVVFYFLLIRPQQKRMKQHKEMLGSIRRGDRVVTNGGIIGTVNKVVNNDELILEIADGVRVRAMRSMVANVVAKTEPAGADEDEAASKP